MARENRLTRRGWNWSPVPAEVILDKELSDFDVRLYSYLLWRAGNKGSAFPGAEKIASEFDVSTAKVLRGYKSLIKNDWIRRFRRYGRSSITCIFETKEECRSYQICYDEYVKFDMINMSNLTRLNESKNNESKNNAANAASPQTETSLLDGYFPRTEKVIVNPTHPPANAAEARARVVAAMERGEIEQKSITETIRSITGRELSTRNKTQAGWLAELREWGATQETLRQCAEYCQHALNNNNWRGADWKPTLKDLWENYRAGQIIVTSKPKRIGRGLPEIRHD